jgi:outer membrane protein
MPLVALLMALSPALAADVKIGSINLDRTFEEFYKTKLADAQLKEQADQFKEERTKLIADYKAVQKAFEDAREEASNSALSEEVRDRRRSEADSKMIDVKEMESKIRHFDDSRQKQLDEQSRRMRKKLVGEIQEQLTKYAAEQGYTAILDNSGESMNGVNLVVYSDPQIDITEAMLAILNKGQATPPAAVKPAAPALKTGAK